MTKRADEEAFFWETYPWVVSDKADDCSGEGGSDEKSVGSKKFLNSSLTNNHYKTKQLEIRSMGGLGGGDEDISTTLVGGRKGNGGDLNMTNGNGPKVSNDDGKKDKRDLESNDHDTHTLTERERRKNMRGMFRHLHALLPQLSSKADKATIVDGAVASIKTLEQTLQKLETQKIDRLRGLSTNTNIPPLIQPQKLALDTRESFLADQGSSTSQFGVVSRASSTSFSLSSSSPTVFQTWTSANVSLNICGLDGHFTICSDRKPGLVTAICSVMEKHKLEIISATMSTVHSKSVFAIHARANAPHEFVEESPYHEPYKKAAEEIMLLVESKAS